MIEPKDLPALSREELLALVVELQRQIAELRTEIDQLKRVGSARRLPFRRARVWPSPSLLGASRELAPSATVRPHHPRRSLRCR